MRLKAWLFPAAGFGVTAVALITGVLIVDRLGPRRPGIADLVT